MQKLYVYTIYVMIVSFMSLTILTKNHAHHKINYEDKVLVAWHEAGHFVSYTYNDSLHVVQHATIKPDIIAKSQGHVQIIRIHSIERSLEQLEHDIISALCGGVSEQIALGKKMLRTHEEILTYFAQQKFSTDMYIAYKDAQELLAFDCKTYKKEEIQEKINDIIVRLYYKAYEFIDTHRYEVKKVADDLMKQETVETETYDFL